MAGARLTLLVLKTRQVEKVCTFYRAVGVDLREERHGTGPIHFAGQLGELVFEVYPHPESAGEVDITTRVGFAVSNLIGAVEALQALAATIVAPPQATPWGHRAVVRDPDGRAVELYEQ